MNAYNPEKNLTQLAWILHGIGLTLICAFIAIYIVGVYLPHGQRHEQTVQEIDSLESRLKKLPDVRREYLELIASCTNLEQRARDLDERIPDDPRDAEFLRQITEVAEHEGILVQDYRRGDVANREGYSELDIGLVCETNFPSMCAFLDRAEQLPRASKIVKCTIATDGRSDRYPVDMTFALYFGAKQSASSDTHKNHD